MFDEERTSREHAGSFLIKDMLKNMSEHVCHQLEKSFKAFASNNIEMANEALKWIISPTTCMKKLDHR